MRELLERLSENMPGEWELRQYDGSPNCDTWELKKDKCPCGLSYYEIICADFDDIGLAPLTALLKQSLPGYIAIERLIADGIIHHWKFRSGNGYEMADTEFECVASAYLSLRPKEASK